MLPIEGELLPGLNEFMSVFIRRYIFVKYNIKPSLASPAGGAVASVARVTLIEIREL